MRFNKICLIIMSIIISLTAQYIQGDFVKNFSFTESDLSENSEIIYSVQSIKDLMESGKVVVISFFNPG